MVADADRCALVGLIQQGVDPGFFQIPDQRFCGDPALQEISRKKTVIKNRVAEEIEAAKLYDRKTPLTAADLLNDRVVLFYESTTCRCCVC
jgi:hypothetical protein